MAIMASKTLTLALLVLAAALTTLPAAAKAPVLPKTVDVKLPAGLQPFAGPDAKAINNNCLACHSRDMVLNQPPMAKPAWEAEVAKMRNVYKAPVAEADVPAIVDYLVRTKGPK
jgi:mono/diheme cytochrome c family protein